MSVDFARWFDIFRLRAALEDPVIGMEDFKKWIDPRRFLNKKLRFYFVDYWKV